MCDALGIDTQGQTRRIKRNEVLEGGYSWVDILSIQPNPQRRRSQVVRIDTQGQRQRINRHKVLNNGLGVCKLHTPSGGSQQAHVLRVDLVPLWLAGIRTTAVNEELRPKLERFQIEAAAVLWEAFQAGRLTTDPAFEDLLISDHPTAQAYRMAGQS